MFGAWQSARFARAEELKTLSNYLRELKPKVQTPAEMLAVLKAIKATGAPMDIERVSLNL